MTWAPPSSTITGEDEFTASYPLEVELVAHGEEGSVSIRKTIPLAIHVAHAPLGPGLLSIDIGSELPSFVEGKTDKFVISGQVSGGGEVPYEIKVLNPPPGATQKTVKSGGVEVTWTPSFSTITGVDQFTTSYPLKVRLVAYGDGGNASIEKIIPLGVQVAHHPLVPDLMAIEVAPEVPGLVEGEEGKFVITGKALVGDDIPIQLEIVNLPSGANTRSVKNGLEVTWRPQFRTVPSGDYFTQYPFQVRLSAISEGEEITKDFFAPVIVYADTTHVPVVQSIEVTPRPIPEDQNGRMTITVLDRSGGANLYFIRTLEGVENGVEHIDLNSLQQVQDSANPNVHRYHFDIDFRSKNIAIVTKTIDLKVGVVAYSRYGVSSEVQEFSYRVLNRISRPVSSWKSGLRFAYGETARVNFTIADARQEGVVSTDFEQSCRAQLKRKYKCKCKNSTKSVLVCELEWFGFNGAPSKTEFTYSVTNKNPHDNTDVKTANHNQLITIYRK